MVNLPPPLKLAVEGLESWRGQPHDHSLCPLSPYNGSNPRSEGQLLGHGLAAPVHALPVRCADG